VERNRVVARERNVSQEVVAVVPRGFDARDLTALEVAWFSPALESSDSRQDRTRSRINNDQLGAIRLVGVGDRGAKRSVAQIWNCIKV
jgi:hypothetical protein